MIERESGIKREIERGDRERERETERGERERYERGGDKIDAFFEYVSDSITKLVKRERDITIKTEREREKERETSKSKFENERRI